MITCCDVLRLVSFLTALVGEVETERRDSGVVRKGS